MHRFFAILLLVTSALGALSVFADTVLVTDLKGDVTLEASGTGKVSLEPFIRLRKGDRLGLPVGGKVGLVYVTKARLETWQGAGIVLVGENDSKLIGGKSQVQVRSIPPEMARQMNKTPVVTSDGRVGMMRTRGISPHDAVVRLENEYKQLREQMPPDELLPEVMFLAGLYDLRQYDRVEMELKRIGVVHPGHVTAEALLALYSKALTQARAHN